MGVCLLRAFWIAGELTGVDHRPHPEMGQERAGVGLKVGQRLIPHILLFHLVQNLSESVRRPKPLRAVLCDPRRQFLPCRFIIVQCHPDLFQVIRTRRPLCRPSHHLHRRQGDANEDINDGDDDEQGDHELAGGIGG